MSDHEQEPEPPGRPDPRARPDDPAGTKPKVDSETLLPAVREPLAPIGSPWVTPAAACAAPMARSSWSTRMC